MNLNKEGRGKHSGSKDKCLGTTLKKAMELGTGDKELFCYRKTEWTGGLAERGSPSTAPNFWCNEEEEGS